MILGIGIDLVDIRRIEASLEQFGERFEMRLFSTNERALAKKRSASGNKAATYAKRFAAKEACAKALGIGHQKNVYLQNIEVINDANGKPELSLSGGAKEALDTLTPKDMKPKLFLAITDEYHYAQAQVIITAE